MTQRDFVFTWFWTPVWIRWNTLLTGIDTEVMLVSVAYTARKVSFVLGGHRCADQETIKKKKVSALAPIGHVVCSSSVDGNLSNSSDNTASAWSLCLCSSCSSLVMTVLLHQTDTHLVTVFVQFMLKLSDDSFVTSNWHTLGHCVCAVHAQA